MSVEEREDRSRRIVAELQQRLAEDAAAVMIFLGAGLSFGVGRRLGRGSFETPPPIADEARFPRRNRSVRLLKPLASDLNEWRMASGRPDEKERVFPMRDGRYWTESAYRNWRRKVFMPAAKAIGIKNPRPYDLRHSFASLLFQEGTNPAEIAEQLGHSLQTLLSTYTHVIDDLRGQPRLSAEDLIREARDSHSPQIAPEVELAPVELTT